MPLKMEPEFEEIMKLMEGVVVGLMDARQFEFAAT